LVVVVVVQIRAAFNRRNRRWADRSLRVQGAAVAKATKAGAAVKQGLRSKKSGKVRKSSTFHRPKTLKAARKPLYERKSAPKTNKLDQFQIIK